MNLRVYINKTEDVNQHLWVFQAIIKHLLILKENASTQSKQTNFSKDGKTLDYVKIGLTTFYTAKILIPR